MRSQPRKKKKDGDKSDKGKGNDDANKESSFAQRNKNYACFCCGDKDCKFKDCCKRATLPKEEWHDPSKFKDSYQQVNNQNVEESRDNEVSFNFAQCHSEVLEGKGTDEEILDSGSTVSVMKDKVKVDDIQKRKVNVLMHQRW